MPPEFTSGGNGARRLVAEAPSTQAHESKDMIKRVCEASIGCIRCSSGFRLRDWRSPNTQSTQDTKLDEHP